MIKASDLRVRDVVNITDGRRLGVMCDIEVDLETGRVTALIVPGPRFLGLFRTGSDYIIPWDRIKKIGPDVVLVELATYTDPSRDWHR